VETLLPPAFGKDDMERLEDQFGRHFPYIRLSVTDQCNFRCQYCLPGGYRKTDSDSFLSADEIIRLMRVFVELGVEKVRLTGGEPALRRDITAIAARLSCLSGLRTIAITTNGYNLEKKAREFFDAGIRALNVSVDSLDQKKFHAITGHDKLREILRGIDVARKVGFTNIKINAVLLKSVNEEDLDAFLRWIRHEDLSIRFIELMQTGDNLEYFQKHHLSAGLIRQKLEEQGFRQRPRNHDSGPAIELEHPEYKGRIGLIAPYSKDFCKSCNRLRITARGDLRLCLFGEQGYSLRPFLAHEDQQEELRSKILKLLHFKRETHDLHMGRTGLTPHLASLGG
jgi:cyclic pyranopterin phosphate synthase